MKDSVSSNQRCGWFGEGRGQCLLRKDHSSIYHTCEQDGRLLACAQAERDALRERRPVETADEPAALHTPQKLCREGTFVDGRLRQCQLEDGHGGDHALASDGEIVRWHDVKAEVERTNQGDSGCIMPDDTL